MGQMRFILGRAGSGKTNFCLDRAMQELQASPLTGPAVILLVPEQATFQMNHLLACRGGGAGFIRARVMSFQRLAQSAVSEVLGTHRPMLTWSRRLIMQQILTAHKDRLRFWNNTPAEAISGSLLELLDELTQANLGPGEMETIRSQLKDRGELDRQLEKKLDDLIAISREYHRMDLVGLDDPMAYLGKYEKLIGRISWLRNALICVDGFSGFTGQELGALVATMQVARETCITLNLEPDQLGKPDPPDYCRVFQPSEQTYFRLLELAQKAGIAVAKPQIFDAPEKYRFAKNPALANLEKFLAGIIPLTDIRHEDIQIVCAENPRQEVELVAGKILQLVRERAFRFRDISVILRRMDTYEHLLRYLFEQYQIPCFLDVRRPVSQHPLTRLILSAVGALSTNFATSWMLRYLKTGLTGVPEKITDRIENYVLSHGIAGTKWQENWRYRVQEFGAEDSEDQATSDLAEINRYRKKLIGPLMELEKFWAVQHDRKQEFSVNNLIDGLMNFLHGLDVSKYIAVLAEGDDHRQNAQVHQQILNVVVELFNQLRVTLNDQNVSLDRFLALLIESFSEMTVGVIPSSADQVLVGTIERSRHPAVRASFILGFNETVWPSAPKEDGMERSDHTRRSRQAFPPGTIPNVHCHDTSGRVPLDQPLPT